MRSLHRLFSSLVIVFSVFSIAAQDCSIPFTTPMFNVQQELDVSYGTATRYNGASEILRLNIYKPIGDGQLERPLLILVHGGGFTGGHRNDLNALCQEFASKGWAAATISYRLDFYGTWLFSSPWAYDPAEVIRAAYRAQQDTRGAIRFLKARHLVDSTSTENVMLMGFSAGAIAILHAALVDDPSEKPASCNAIGSVSHLFSSYPRPDLGPYQGTLNLNGMNEDVLGVASMYGGLLDTNLISGPLDPALYLYHQTGDPVVGCGHQKGLWGMPLGVGDNYPYLFGSCVNDVRIQHLDPAPGRYAYHEHNGSEHAVHDPDAIYMEATEFLRDLFCSPVVPAVTLSVRVMLEGPYNTATGLMNDALRNGGSFPLVDPYPSLGYGHVNGSGSVVSPTVLNSSGNDAIVDWVVLELRDPSDPFIVLDSRSALLQRDGDVVDVDGFSPVSFTLSPGNYYVALLHRNHMPIMTLNAISLGTNSNAIDLTVSGTQTFGSEARKSIEGPFPAQVLWAGDVNFDNVIRYTGDGNDRDLILESIGGVVPTNTITGYRMEDVNMDGSVKYTGESNDRDIILENIGGVVPTNTRTAQMP